MDENIIFLGTGGGRIVVANQISATGGFILNLEGYQIHVDPGPGATARAKQFKVKPNKTDIFFVSHNHLDHANDINAGIYAVTLDGIHKKGILIAPSSVMEGENALLTPFYKNTLKEFFPVTVGDKVKLGKLEFNITKADHDADTVGFKIKTPNLTIGYTSDTAMFPELVEIYKDCDILIMNVLRPGRDKWKTHLCSDDVVDIISKVKPELALIYHFGAKMIRARPIYEAREIQRKTGIRTMAAVDGMKIDFASISASKKNKDKK